MGCLLTLAGTSLSLNFFVLLTSRCHSSTFRHHPLFDQHGGAAVELPQLDPVCVHRFYIEPDLCSLDSHYMWSTVCFLFFFFRFFFLCCILHVTLQLIYF